MGKRILNKNNCTFICPALQGTITKTQLDHRFNDATGVTLTQQTALSGNGICSILTASADGVPTPCTLVMAANWISGIELNKRINGVSILNEDAKMQCPVGSMITVQKPMLPIVSLNTGIISGGSEGQGSANSQASLSNEDKCESFDEENSISDDNKQTESSSEEDGDIDETASLEEFNEEASKKESLCSYASCERASECPYMKAPGTLKLHKYKLPSRLLRENSPQKFAAYDEQAKINMQKANMTWPNQAHHMISIKDAYARYPGLVKLGNYFGYDINCQENCCFLPASQGEMDFSVGAEIKFKDMETHFQKTQAYSVMKASGLQWHVGHHDYRITIPEGIKEKYPELREIDCYNDKLNKDMKKIVSECSQHFNGMCLEDNFEEHKKWFIDKMNSLSAEIETNLALFGRNPKDSFPYFVSLEALRFAYEVPRAGKVIFIYKTETQWVLKRYQYANCLKDPDIQLNLLENKILAIAENRRPETIKKIALFCENVTCFLIADESKSFKLPFEYKVKTQYISVKEAEKKESHFSAMLAEQIDNGDIEYIAPKAMAVKRLKECGLI